MDFNNFKYLDELIHSGANEINLDSDIILEDKEEQKYPDGIKLDADNLVINGNGHIINSKEKTRIFHSTAQNITIKTDDDVPFNGKVSVELPDGTIQTAEITEGIGNTTWTVPDDYNGEYNYTVRFEGDGTYLPSNNTAIIKVDSKIQVEIIVGNITAKPKDKVTIPIEVITAEESLFNGNVTVRLPDGTEVTAQITNGEGSVEWTVPEDYNGTYSVSVRFDGDDTFLEADGNGLITVNPDTPDNPDNPVVPVSPVAPDNPASPASPVAPAKHSANKPMPMDKTAPGNPIMALLIVLSSLIFVRRSRK